MDAREILREHLEAWRAAGVDWLPRGSLHLSLTTPQTDSAKPTKVPKPSTATPLSPTPPVVTNAGSSLGSTPLVSPPTGLSTEARRLALDTLDREQVKGCKKCGLCERRTQTVFGVGNVDCDLCFVGEGPGADEDAQGEPFVGAAGQLLNRIIEACKMQRRDVYICNVVKCRPPGNRTPLPDEIASCRPYLVEQLRLLQPKFICCLGAVAAQTVLQSPLSIGKRRGRMPPYEQSQVLCTYHPAYLLRNPAAKRDVWEDMKMLMKEMGRPVE
ncbi:MAG TPA: uracil-DNA glycosylase [Gemmatales bacterium]|nr:uracil-DNA glycosylase [Gemmatales bacterium]